MNNKPTLLIGFHSNLPDFFNEDTRSIFDEHSESLATILDLITKNKNLKLNIHLTKNIIKYLDLKYPDFYSKISNLIETKQIELLSGGLYEPLFPLTPKEDKEIQIKLMNRLLNHTFGYTATGGWIPGFAWSSALASDFSKAKISYSLLPSKYFLNSGISKSSLHDYFVTEDDGRKLSLFPIWVELEKLIKKSTPKEAIEIIEKNFKDNSLNSQVICYNGSFLKQEKKEWLLEFFNLANESENFKLDLFNEFYSNTKPKGRVYISGSDSLGNLSWKHSLIKYPEANLLHKKMLRVSKKISAAKEGKSRFKVIKEMINNAHDLMLKGQRNNFYWDTMLGGVYSPYDRFKAYSRLIEAENLIEKASKQKDNKLQLLELDYDCDGNDEVIIETETQNIYISPESGGTILEHDYREKNINIINTMSRKEEEYINDEEYNARIRDFMKANFIDRFFNKSFSIDDCISGKVQDLFIPCLSTYEIDKVKAKEQTSKVILYNSFNINNNDIKLTKSISVKSAESTMNLDYEILNQGDKEANLLFGIELNYNLAKDKNDKLVFSTSGNESEAYASSEIENTNGLSLINNSLGIGLNVDFDKSFKLYKYPIETYLQTLDSIEKTFQGITFLPSWEFKLQPNEKVELKIVQTLSNLNPQIETKDSENILLKT